MTKAFGMRMEKESQEGAVGNWKNVHTTLDPATLCWVASEDRATMEALFPEET